MCVLSHCNGRKLTESVAAEWGLFLVPTGAELNLNISMDIYICMESFCYKVSAPSVPATVSVKWKELFINF